MCDVNSQRLFVVTKLVLYVGIKAFCYTNRLKTNIRIKCRDILSPIGIIGGYRMEK